MAKGKSRGQAQPTKERDAGVDERPAAPAALKKKVYRSELAGLQVEMFKLQEWLSGCGQPLVVILEGLGPAGKRTTAQCIADCLHRRLAQVVTLEPPGKRERAQWHFQRFVEHFPAAGKLVIFDGSWYHYPAMERALGICGTPEFHEFLEQCASFEQTLVASGVQVVKYWFAASDQEQDRRFRDHVAELAKQKRFYIRDVVPNCSPLSVAQVRDAVLGATDKPQARWYIVQADDKQRARLNCMRHLLSLVTAGPSSDETPGARAEYQPNEADSSPSNGGGQAGGALSGPTDRSVPAVF